MTPAGVFISYRRADTQAWAGRLHADLCDRLGTDRVFRDVAIPPGVDFVEHIERVLDGCEVVLALIGPRWTTVTGEDGRRRLDDPDDLVRREIERALVRRDVHVVPVLVEGARMPAAASLPPGLDRLARRNAYELSDSRWDYDVDVLAERLRPLLGEPPPPPPDDPDDPDDPGDPGGGRERRRLAPQVAAWPVAGALVAAAVVGAVVAEAVTGPVDDRLERPPLSFGDVGGDLGVLLPHLGRRLANYATQRSILWGLVGALCAAAAVAVAARSGGRPGAVPLAALRGLVLGALAGALGALLYVPIKAVTALEREEWLLQAINVGVAGAVLGLALARHVPRVGRGAAALAGLGGGALVGLLVLSRLGPEDRLLGFALAAAAVTGAVGLSAVAAGRGAASEAPRRASARARA